MLNPRDKRRRLKTTAGALLAGMLLGALPALRRAADSYASAATAADPIAAGSDAGANAAADSRPADDHSHATPDPHAAATTDFPTAHADAGAATAADTGSHAAAHTAVAWKCHSQDKRVDDLTVG